MYVCDFCEEKTDKLVGFVPTKKLDEEATIKLCFSCFEVCFAS